MEMTSAVVPALGATDHVDGEGREAIVYVDLSCPHCAAVWGRIPSLPLRLCFRHFPMQAKHFPGPRRCAAAEAAGLQGVFWPMADSSSPTEAGGRPASGSGPERFGLDLDRFRADSRSQAVAARVRRDFESGVRAGVSGTPAAFAGGRPLSGEIEQSLAGLAAGD